VKRSTILLGRGGTILLSIGLALLLVSLIPSAQISLSMSTGELLPRGTWRAQGEGVLTPQQSLRITVTTDHTLNVKVLDESEITIITWIYEHHLPPLEYPNNITYLTEFLAQKPEIIRWETDVQNGLAEYEYVPTKITNATIVFSNPSSEDVHFDSQVIRTSMVAPRGKVQTLALWATPIGFVLALPWLIVQYRTRTRRHASKVLIQSV